jgi:regulator of protease activity HflC (stomatin/prohibitin superfamily)
VQKIYQVQTARDTINFYTGAAMGEAAPSDDVALSVPSSDGLIVTVDVSVMYRTKPEKAPHIIQNLGEWYRSYTVMPQIRSAVREITGTMKAEELYGPGREKLQKEAFALLESKLERDGFVVEDVLIRGIDLPSDFLRSIEAKKIMEQDAIRKQTELKLAEFEAQRKKTEAEGLANYKIEVARGDAEALRLVAKVLEENPKVLDFKKLEITEKLYENPNTKFVALPSNEMILSLPADVMSSEA